MGQKTSKKSSPYPVAKTKWTLPWNKNNIPFATQISNPPIPSRNTESYLQARNSIRMNQHSISFGKRRNSRRKSIRRKSKSKRKRNFKY